MRVRPTLLVALTAAVTLASTGVVGPGAAKPRVPIASRAAFDGDVVSQWNAIAQAEAVLLRPTAHGQSRGIAMVEGAVYDLNDPGIVSRIPFGVVDHVARATCNGSEGWGLFEHGTMGRHDPSGFADFRAVAP